MILRLNMLLLKKPNNLLLQLTTSFSWNDLHQRNFSFYRFIDDVVQGLVNFPTLVVNLMKVEFQFSQFVLLLGVALSKLNFKS